MATAKNRPDNGSMEQGGKEGSRLNTTGRIDPKTLPGDRATNEETRNAGLPGTQRKGAETTQMGTNERRESGSSTKEGERIDLKAGGKRMSDQNAGGAGDTNEDDERDEFDEDHAELPGADMDDDRIGDPEDTTVKNY